MALEIPGIYLRGDSDVMVFDHAEAKVLKSDGKKVTLQITNPTSRDASYTVMAEKVETTSRPLGDNAFVSHFIPVSVKAGKTRTITLRLQ